MGKISVIIPCYNQAEFLPDALNSLLAQSYTNWEAIVVDDGSEDDVLSVVDKINDGRIKYVRQDNKGLPSARNTGLIHATGNYIQFLDADDHLHPLKFEGQISGIKKHNADISISGYWAYKHPDVNNGTTTDTELKGLSPLHEFIYRWENGLCIPIHCFLYTKRVMSEVGLFRTDLPNHEDWDFHIRTVSRMYKYIHDPSRFALYRIHDKSICRSMDMSEGKAMVMASYAVNHGIPEEMRDYLRQEVLKLFPDYSFPETVNSNSSDRYDLTPITFVICARIDSQDRLNNLDFCIDFLQTNFWTNIVIAEEDVESKIKDRYRFVDHVFIQNDDTTFHRTKLINKMVREHVHTPYFCNMDADVFLPKEAYIESLEALQTFSIVYPYDGKFYDIPNHYTENHLLKESDINRKELGLINPNSFGGAVFFRVWDFIDGGMENEHFVSWAPEDNERYMRFAKLGYKIKRLKRPIYHFSHYRGSNSDSTNPYYVDGVEEYSKICLFSRQELLDYIRESFTWL